MAHFAEIDQNNKVINTIFIEDKYILDENGVESEEVGIQYLKDHHGQEKNWLKTSINNNIRGHFAEIGGYYLPDKNRFTTFKPYQSWILNDDNLTWRAPVSPPNNVLVGYYYEWDESSLQWKFKKFPPKEITVESFRQQLILTEKLLWDNPDSATTPSQKAIIVTFKSELPLTEGTGELNELLNLLVSEGVFTQQRLDEIISSIPRI